jgi:hypothetical protein
MDAIPVFFEKVDLPSGHISEIVVWRVPEPVPGSLHYFKYRLYFGSPGKRIIGYDNERGKGDHKHTGEVETLYVFTSVGALVRDFRKDVAEWISQSQER